MFEPEEEETAFVFDIGLLGFVNCVVPIPTQVITVDASDQTSAVPSTSAFCPFKDGRGEPVELFTAGTAAPSPV